MIDENEVKRAYEIANNARAMGFDPRDETEIIPAPDLAARVEAIVGPKGIAEKIRELSKGSKNRTQLAFAVAGLIIDGAFGTASKDKIIEQAVRTGTAVLTEGVLVAPTEGISAVKINKNPDGSDYLAIYYAGPIRGAGGTSAAVSVLLGDFARRKLGIGEYRPTDTAVERYVEEIDLYDLRGARLQYKPSEEDLRWIIKNCPVCIDGEPTEDFEVGAYRNVPGIETNRVRGGVCLVVCEGIAQKAAKVLSLSRKINTNWDWLEAIIKVPKTKEKMTRLQPDSRYLDEVVAGRPIFAYPSRQYGFRLRYGRTRISGIHAKSVHPATMVVLNSFIAIGTQLKIERPGKSATIVPCDTIEPPVVKLDDGSVAVVRTMEEAITLKDRISKILWLGDLLIGYGDFLKTNTPLLPAGYCEEWWQREVEAAEKQLGKKAEARKELTAEEAFKISEEFGVPLHPKYTFFWNNVNGKELKDLIRWIRKVEQKYDWLKLKEITVDYSPEKTILEKIMLPHRVDKETVSIDSDNAYALLKTLNLLGKMDQKHTETMNETIADDENGLDVVNRLAGVRIRDKGGSWIGCRMGRPEKVKERPMKPPVHVLFPISNAGGKTRNIMRAYRDAKANKLKFDINVEVARLKCELCGNITSLRRCELCGGHTKSERVCTKCGRIVQKEEPIHDSCGGRVNKYEERPLNIVKVMEDAIARTKTLPEEMKGVIGLMSEEKIPEPLEKGIFRAKYGAYVFKDGTCRFDATNAPMTHFYPREMGTPIERLRQLGYTKDAEGKELTDENQLVELRPEDMIVSERCAEYLLRVSRFIDDTLTGLYKTDPYYKLKNREDMIGQIVIELSPHTSCGILGRIIGLTKAHVCYAHPYMFCASRRDCDGDENSVMLLMDGLLNFSKSFLPRTRGGQMDAPLVLMTKIDPNEIDDQVYGMEICKEFQSEFYEATLQYKSPSEVDIETVADRLNTDRKDRELWFTHQTSSINNGVTMTSYVALRSMKEKIDSQLNLAEKIAAVDEKDAAERVILSHFFPDLYGNMRSFTRQQVRCVDCNFKYRRPPLSGKCNKCGGKLILTINRGGIEKYLKISQQMVDTYGLPHYMKQRLNLLEKDLKSMFEDETSKQFNLAEFM